MNYLKDRRNNKLFIIISLFFAISCKQEYDVDKQVYYYDVLSSEHKISAYYKRVCVLKDKAFRIDSVYRYNLEGKLVSSEVEHYDIRTNRLSIVFDYENEARPKIPYLSVGDENDCIDTKFFYGDSIRVCFLGKEELLIDEVLYPNSLNFTRDELILDGKTVNTYFDDDFVLIREEFKTGFIGYYRIDRRSSIPKVLR